MLPDLFKDANAGGWGVIVWPIWIIAAFLAIGCAFVTRATWRQIVAARKAQDAGPPQP